MSTLIISVSSEKPPFLSRADIILTDEGLSTIITAINRSRMIFRRLNSYIIYRLASSTFFIAYFFTSICALKFEFPTWVLIFVSLVNDFTAMATSKDNVRTSDYPLYWDLPRLSVTAIVIGGLCALQCFLLTYFCLAGAESYPGLGAVGLGNLLECETVAVVYLSMAISIQLNIFSARNKKFFWMTEEKYDAAPAPSLILITPVAAALIVSTFIAVYWDPELALGGGNPMKGAGWVPCIATWIWCLAWFCLIECAKVMTNFVYDSQADVSIGDLLFSPIFELIGFSDNFDFAKAEEEEKKLVSDKMHAHLPTSGSVVLSTPGLNTVTLAAREDHPPLSVPVMPHMGGGASPADLVEMVNAMRQHILMLETRLVELDGIRVAQTPARTSTKYSK